MKKNNSRYWFLGGALIILIGYFLYDSFSQPSIKDLPGDLEEVAFVRNEQNKGGIIRIYAITVGDITHADFDKCADYLPVNDYGSVTKVYFFDKSKPYPTDLSIDEPHFDDSKFQAVRIIRRYGKRPDA